MAHKLRRVVVLFIFLAGPQLLAQQALHVIQANSKIVDIKMVKP